MLDLCWLPIKHRRKLQLHYQPYQNVCIVFQLGLVFIPLGIFFFHLVFLSVQCPFNTTQVGEINADIAGCGMEFCPRRYDKNTTEECHQHCLNHSKCKSFTWAPIGGDKNHLSLNTCTIYTSAVPNRLWGPNQIMCKLNPGMALEFGLFLFKYSVRRCCFFCFFF